MLFMKVLFKYVYIVQEENANNKQNLKQRKKKRR